jgi:hypothetical protein
MEAVAPRTILRDVLIGFGIGLVLMLSLSLVPHASASQTTTAGQHALGR